MDTGAAVDLRRVLAGEQGDPHLRSDPHVRLPARRAPRLSGSARRTVHTSDVDLLPLAHNDYAALGDHEALPVALQVDTDARPWRHFDVLVDDGVAHHRAATNADPVHQHRPGNQAVRVHFHPRREHRAVYLAAGDDDAGADH